MSIINERITKFVENYSILLGSIKRGYAGMTSDCIVGGLCEIFMRD